MNINITQAQIGYKEGGCKNVVSFAGYVARHGRKSSFSPMTNLVKLEDCDVIDLASRRH